MIQLTQKGKEVLGENMGIRLVATENDRDRFLFIKKENETLTIVNPLELKALVELGLVEIK